MTRIASTTRLLLIAVVGFVGAIVAFPAPTFAAESQGFQISPPVTELSLNPGTSTKQSVKVTNLTNQQITLNVSKANFVAKGEEGEVELTDNADPLYSLAPYFNISGASVDVPPLASSTVNYTISVPANAEPGGRYGSITFTAAPGSLAPGESGASVQQQLASLIFLRINGNTNESVKVASLNAGVLQKDSNFTNKNFFEYGPISFDARFQNVGSVHEKPTGQIVIKNEFGVKVATIKLDEQNVIPGAIRRTISTWNKHLLFGHYTATLTANIGDQETLTAKTSFTVIPYKLVGGIAIVLVLLLLFFFKARKRFSRAIRILAGRE